MAAINARFVFTPAVPGVNSANPITVNADSLTDIKAGVKAALAAKRLISQSDVNAIDAADAALEV